MDDHVKVGIIKRDKSKANKQCVILAGSVYTFARHKSDEEPFSIACCAYLKSDDLARIEVRNGYEFVFARKPVDPHQDDIDEIEVDESELNVAAMIVLKQYAKEDSFADYSLPAIFSDVIIMRKNKHGDYVNVCMDKFMSMMNEPDNDVEVYSRYAADADADDIIRKLGLPKFSEN